MKERNTYLFGLVPSLGIAENVIRSGREFEVEVQTKEAVRVLHKIKQRCYFVLNLVPTSTDLLLKTRQALEMHLRRKTEDVRVILHKTAHSHEASESTRRLISVDDAELGHADQ
jgi:hypothetical protein